MPNVTFKLLQTKVYKCVIQLLKGRKKFNKIYFLTVFILSFSDLRDITCFNKNNCDAKIHTIAQA